MNCLPNEIATDLGCIPNTPAGFTQKYFQIGLGIIGGVSFLGMIYGMILIGSSQGNTIQIQKGKKIVTSSIIGLLLAIFSIFIVRLIAIDILHIPGFGN